MATSNEQNLTVQNAAYASSFTQGGLALHPSRKLAIGSSNEALALPLRIIMPCICSEN